MPYINYRLYILVIVDYFFFSTNSTLFMACGGVCI